MTAPDPEALSRHRRLMSKLLKVHFLAYLPGFAAAVAAIPFAVRWELAGGASGADELDVLLFILARACAAFAVAFLVSHALGVPWARGSGEAGRRLALVGPVAMTALAVIAGGIGWIELLSS
ncbi:MAG: hypothetical protein IPG04_04295 [Polyangiaceae bacterium]|jgi:hypothetical protein|nr:hypothetical protein [Polyangiaceae bacterium]